MKKFVSLLLALLMIASLAACGKKANDNNDSKDSKTLIMGTSADYAPFEFMYKGEDGTMQYGGIDVSVGQYIAESMGKELKVENTEKRRFLRSLLHRPASGYPGEGFRRRFLQDPG